MEGYADAGRLNHAYVQHFSPHAETFGGEPVGHVTAASRQYLAELLTLTARTVIYLAGSTPRGWLVNSGIGAKCGK